MIYEDTAHPVYLTEDVRLDEAKVKKLISCMIDPVKWVSFENSREEIIKRIEVIMGGTVEFDPSTGEKIKVPGNISDEDKAEVEYLRQRLEELPEDNWVEFNEMPTGEVYISDWTDSIYSNYSRDGLFFSAMADRSYMWLNEALAVQNSKFDNEIDTITELPEPEMPRERTLELTHEILAELGINEDEFGPVNVEKAQKLDANNKPAGLGWLVTCRMQAPGAMHFDSFHYQMDGGPVGSAILDNAAEYRPDMRQETLDLYFEDGKLCEADWDYPQRIVSIVNPAVELMPFGEIQQRILNIFRYSTAWTGKENHTFNDEYVVSEVALTYWKTAKMDDVDRYWWSPVWAVAFRSNNASRALTFTFFINAIDGSVIAVQ